MADATNLKTFGIVTLWRTDKGFGFISGKDGKEYFFHITALAESISSRDIHAGDVVGFQISQGDLGLKADNVELSSETTSACESYEVSDAASPSAHVLVEDFTQELVKHLQAHPTDLYRIHPKTFEELVAAIFRNQGFDTEFIGSWNQADGGVDVIAVRRLDGEIPIRMAIQCKRYGPHRQITADPIRSLAGVLDRFRAHVGVVATTSYFTASARKETDSHLWRIDLKDYEDIVSSLRKFDLIS